MRVVRLRDQASHSVSFALLDDAGQPVPAIAGFLGHLGARGYSPNTVSAYAHDLLHFERFLRQRRLAYAGFTPVEAVVFLEHLAQVPSRKRTQAVDAVGGAEPILARLAPTSVNRVLVAVSSFFEYLIVSGQLALAENPVQKTADLERARVAERHRPAMGAASRQRPVRRVVRVRTVERLPRPLSDEQVAALLGSLVRWRDRAMVLLMLQGGLRPGEVLNLHLEDVQYGRRVFVRHRTDHPKGARTKSRHERVVDLHEPEALAAVSAYVMRERPTDADTTLVFLVGGHGGKRCEALSYQALVRLFARRCERLGIREPWLTPHALRHTHATKMWEGGMRELALQKRLGHASPESTRMYTRVSDPAVLAEYRRALGLGDAEARP